MAADKSESGLWSSLAALAKSYGLGGMLLIGAPVLIGIAIYKAPDLHEPATQLAVLAIGCAAGAVSGILGWRLLRRGAAGLTGERDTTRRFDVFIAAPMSGYGADEAGRRAAVELVRRTEAALRRLGDVANVHAPALMRPEAANYETPATAFDIELEAIRASKRYLLILPPAAAVGTSVLMTTGMAIALELPCVVLAPEGRELPYLLEGAVQSRQIKLRLCRYDGPEAIERLIANNQLHLFGEE